VFGFPLLAPNIYLSEALENDLRVFPFGNRLGRGVLGQHCELTTIPSIRFTLGKEVLQMLAASNFEFPLSLCPRTMGGGHLRSSVLHLNIGPRYSSYTVPHVVALPHYLSLRCHGGCRLGRTPMK